MLVFLTRYLKIPAERTCNIVFTAKQLPNRQNPHPDCKVKNKVLVTFETVEQRDKVGSHARNLQGKDEVGLNIEVPYHFHFNFVTL